MVYFHEHDDESDLEEFYERQSGVCGYSSDELEETNDSDYDIDDDTG